MPEVTCTHCGKSKAVTVERMASLIGKTVRCSACQSEFVIRSDPPAESEGSVDWNDVLAPTAAPAVAAIPDRSKEELASRIQTSSKWSGAGKWLAIPVCVLLSIGGFWYFGQTPHKADEPQKLEVSAPPASTEVSPAVTYRIANIEEKNNPDFAGGQQMRFVSVVLTPSPSKAAVDKIANEVYQLFRREIELLQPNARLKQVRLLIYDDIYNQHELICTAESGVWPTPTLPNTIEVKWMYCRLPEHRPSEEWLSLEREYMKGLEAASKAAEAGANERIKATPDQWKALIQAERLRRNVRVSILVGKLMEQHHLTEKELAHRLSYVFVWKFGLVPSDELVAKQTKDTLDDWKELVKPSQP